MIDTENLTIVFTVIFSFGCILIVYMKCLLIHDDQYRDEYDKYQSFSEELLENRV